MKEVTIYTDGACSGNPGPGGWGAILMCNGIQKEISGAQKNTTNNIMEITAVVEALKCLRVESNVQVYSDSAYTVNACKQGWIYNWMKNGWKTADKQDVKNQDLWKPLVALYIKLRNRFDLEIIKVESHKNNK